MFDDFVCTPISDAELERRWAAVRIEMEDQGVDVLLLQNCNDWLGGYLKWFTDIPATNAYPRTILFPRTGRMVAIEQGPIGIEVAVKDGDVFNRGVERVLYSAGYSSACFTARYDAELAIKEIRRAGYKTVGAVNSSGMYHDFFAAVKASGAARIVDFTEAVDRIKAIKSDEEMAMIRRTATMQDEIFDAVAKHIRPGMHDFEVTAYAQYLGQLKGSEQGVFLGSSSPLGRASLFRPRHAQARKLEEGDHMTLLVENNGPGGHYTELARTLVLGKASTELADLFAAMVESQGNTLQQLKVGTACKDVFAAHNDYMTRRGYVAERRLYCHGQGYDMVERPLIRDDESMHIAEGMSIVVHPAYANENVFMTVCDNYLIGPNGAGECLHSTPKTVIEV